MNLWQNVIMSEKFKKLEKLLGYSFKDKSLLKAALSHKSARSGVNNERLEFLKRLEF